MVRLSLRTVWPYLVRLEILILETLVHVHEKTHKISIQGRIINCKQPIYSSVEEWINKCWYGLKMECFRVVEVNELWLPVTA